MKRIMMTIAVASMLLSSAGTSRVRALEPGQKLVVEVIGISTRHSPGQYGATGATSSSGSDLSEGETGRSYLSYGRVDDTAGFALRNLCTNSCGSIREEDDPNEVRERVFKTQGPAHYWSFAYRVLPAEIGKVSLEVAWEHWSQVGTGTAIKVGGDTRRIEMVEGERSVLDSVFFDPPPNDYCASSVQVAIGAHVMEDPSLQYELLSYDVWFEHEEASGRITRRRFEGIGRQDEEVSFHVLPMRFPVPDARTVDGVPYDAILEMSGSIRGLVRKDGSIQVRLSAGRWTDVEEHGKPRRGGIGDGGKKIFTIEPGETVRMTLPVPGGSNGINETVTRNGVVIGKNEVKVDNAVFYEGSQDSIILTVDRVR